jgi:LysR family transcriptional regulator (chromosome initiation inhibitor)
MATIFAGAFEWAARALHISPLAGLGWGLNTTAGVALHLHSAAWVAWMPDPPLDVPLYGQETRAQSAVMEGLSRAVLKAAQDSLIAQTTGIRIG